jgi:YD repeat-containing protein
VRINQPATFVFAGLAMLALVVGVSPAYAQEPQPAPAQPEAAQAQSIQGDLVSVDAEAKVLTVKDAEGKEVQFAYNDSTDISGTQGAAGLATMKEGRVTVHFTEDAETKKKTATRIIVEAS